MFTRLFGETDEQQVAYLKNRVIITLISLVIAFFFPPAFALVMLFVWGWNAVKALFGITSLAALFSGNVIIGSVFFVLYVMLSYLIGMFCAALGIGRYIYLLIKYKGGKTE